MELTLRQRAFLDKLIDLYYEARQPIHYSVLAERLGVSRFSAYDMLRLLEAKGLVRSEYVLTGRKGGPGRSAVVFHPLARAKEALFRLVGTPAEQQEWAATQERILNDLRQAVQGGNNPLEKLLTAIPKAISPLAYSAQVLSTLFYTARNLIEELDRGLSTLLASEECAEPGSGLDLLAGFALGLSLTTEGMSREIYAKLVEYSRTCQSYIQAMGVEQRHLLAKFMREIVALLRSPKVTAGGTEGAYTTGGPPAPSGA